MTQHEKERTMTDSALVPRDDNAGLMTFGQTELDPGDIKLPRIKLLQAQSGEVADSLGSVGDFYNTLTNENYGPTLGFLPILPFKQRIMLVREERKEEIDAALVAAELPPLADDAKGLVCRSFDMIRGNGDPGVLCGGDVAEGIPPCPLAVWDGRKPPFCSETYNVAAVTEDGSLIVLSFSKSSASVGKQLFSIIRMGGRQAKMFELASRSERGARGNYQVPLVRVAGPAAPELIREANDWAAQLRGARTLDVTPDDDDAAEPVVTSPVSTAGAQPSTGKGKSKADEPF